VAPFTPACDLAIKKVSKKGVGQKKVPKGVRCRSKKGKGKGVGQKRKKVKRCRSMVLPKRKGEKVSVNGIAKKVSKGVCQKVSVNGIATKGVGQWYCHISAQKRCRSMV
jgi:hypothetical protein